jgi:hypothetical protein
MIFRYPKTIFALLILIPVLAYADDFYVITATYKTQKEAQDVAALKGGWVLNTNFYNKLTPNLYAVVRGPYQTQATADEKLAWLTNGGRYPGSYVKNPGNINIEVKVGNKALSPQMLAALLGELRIDVLENNGASHPCEPQEPYKQLSLSYVTIARHYDDKNEEVILKPKDVELDAGAFREIEKTGEIVRMRICAE